MELHFYTNPLTKLSRTLDANNSLVTQFVEIFKLAQIAVVHFWAQ